VVVLRRVAPVAPVVRVVRVVPVLVVVPMQLLVPAGVMAGLRVG
jgi:hypothetical protein